MSRIRKRVSDRRVLGLIHRMLKAGVVKLEGEVEPTEMGTPQGSSLSRFEVDAGYDRGYTTSMKTAISLPDQLFEAAEQLAKRLGLSRSELYATALERFVKTNRGKGVREQLDEVYGDEDAGELEPGYEALQAASIDHEEW